MQWGVNVLGLLADVQHDPLVQRRRSPASGCAGQHFCPLQRRREHVPVGGQAAIQQILFFIRVRGEMIVELEGGRRGGLGGGVQEERRPGLDVLDWPAQGAVRVVVVEALQFHGCQLKIELLFQNVSATVAVRSPTLSMSSAGENRTGGLLRSLIE